MKIAQRVELISMDNDPNPIPVGTRGTITGINPTPVKGELQISVDWDNGRTLMLLYPIDKFKILTQEYLSIEAMNHISDLVKKDKANKK